MNNMFISNKMELPINFLSYSKIQRSFISFINFSSSSLLLNKYPPCYNYDIICFLFRVIFDINYYVILANGSDEIIRFIIGSYNVSGLVCSFYPTFSMYEKFSLSLGKGFIYFYLNSKFGLNIYYISSFLNKRKITLFFLSYPNNPTGNLLHLKHISFLVRSCPKTFFVIDEAYYYFCGSTLLNIMSLYKNVSIIRTLSKIGFASVRFGFMICNNYLYHYFNSKKSPYPISLISMFFIFAFFSNPFNFLFLINIIYVYSSNRDIIYFFLNKYIRFSFGNFFLFNINNNPIAYFVFLSLDILFFKTFNFNNNLYIRFSSCGFFYNNIFIRSFLLDFN